MNVIVMFVGNKETRDMAVNNILKLLNMKMLQDNVLMRDRK